MKHLKAVIGSLLIAFAVVSSAQSTEQAARAARIRAARAQAYVDKWDLLGLESLVRRALEKAQSIRASFEDVAYAYEICAQFLWNRVSSDSDSWEKDIFTLAKKFKTFKIGNDNESKRIKAFVDMDGWEGWGNASTYEECKALIRVFPNDPGLLRTLGLLDVGHGKGIEPILRSFQYFAAEIKKYPNCLSNYGVYAGSASILGKRIPTEKKKYYTIARDAYRKSMTLVPKGSSAYELSKRRAEGFQKAINEIN